MCVFQSEYGSNRSRRFPPSDSNQRPSNNSLDVATAISSPEYSGSVASSGIEENLEYTESQRPEHPRLGHLHSSPYFQEDSASYGSPLSDSRLPFGIQKYSASAFDDIRSQNANNATLDHPRPLEPRVWGSAHDTATSVLASPPYSTQGTLRPPDDFANYGYTPNSASESFKLATNRQPALPYQAHSNLSRSLGQDQTSYVDPSSLVLNPDPSLIGAQQHSAIADNGWQSAYQRVPAAHPSQSGSNAIPPNATTTAMRPALVHEPWSRPAFESPNASPQQQVGPQPAPDAHPTDFVSYVAPPDAGSNVGLTPTSNRRPASGFPGNSRSQYI